MLNKVRRKQAEPEKPTRITTDTLAEHRERILAGGRRFKYPVQYARHKLVFNAIIISVATLILLGVVGWWQLYIVQNTSDFMYRVTRVIPVPVATIEGESVRYSDYLMRYRSSIHYLEEKEQVNLSTEDGRRQSDFVKNQAMQDALLEAYARKIANEQGITVSDAELEAFLIQQRNSTDGEASEATYEAVIMEYYGWSMDEYRQIMYTTLLRQKVAYAVDEAAKTTSDKVKAVVASNNNLQEVTDAINASEDVEVSFGALGLVPRSNQDGGLAKAAAELDVNQVSDAIISTTGDGYYFVKLIEKNDTQVNYEYIHVPLSTFSQRVNDVRQSAEKTSTYITIPEVETQQQQ